jgi:hypothetical protein
MVKCNARYTFLGSSACLGLNESLTINPLLEELGCRLKQIQEAVLFCYPYKADEGTQATHIHNIFIAISGAPERVIQYDKCVQTKIAQLNSP